MSMPAAEPAGAVTPAVPGPPPGPGVRPPFVAPPIDGRRRRRTIAGWLAGAGVALVLIGGVVGVGALVVLGNKMIEEESVAAVRDHLSAIRDQDFSRAYDQLCASERSQYSVASYMHHWQEVPRIATFSVDKPQIADTVVVPAHLVLRDDTTRVIRFRLEPDTSTGDFEVCGTEG